MKTGAKTDYKTYQKAWKTSLRKKNKTPKTNTGRSPCVKIRRKSSRINCIRVAVQKKVIIEASDEGNDPNFTPDADISSKNTASKPSNTLSLRLGSAKRLSRRNSSDLEHFERIDPDLGNLMLKHEITDILSEKDSESHSDILNVFNRTPEIQELREDASFNHNTLILDSDEQMSQDNHRLHNPPTMESDINDTDLSVYPMYHSREEYEANNLHETNTRDENLQIFGERNYDICFDEYIGNDFPSSNGLNISEMSMMQKDIEQWLSVS